MGARRGSEEFRGARVDPLTLSPGPAGYPAEDSPMGKKQLIALADTIRTANQRAYIHSQPQPFIDSTVRELASFCASINPRFSRERLLGYIAGECGPNGGER